MPVLRLWMLCILTEIIAKIGVPYKKFLNKFNFKKLKFWKIKILNVWNFEKFKSEIE
jgi:hypothetical protein